MSARLSRRERIAASKVLVDAAHPSRVALACGLLVCVLILAGCSSGGGSTSAIEIDDGVDGGGAGAGAAEIEASEFGASWGLGAINAQAAYAAGATGDGVIVAVIDTGVDIDHPDLAANVSDASINIVTAPGGDEDDLSRGPSTADDADGHGTNVAGIIAAIQNDIGTQGVAFEAEILAIRADAQFNSCGDDCGFTDPDLAAAVDYAVENGADIINLSLGGPAPNAPVLDQALAAAAAAGVIVVAAAGNQGAPLPDNPARFAGTAEAAGLALAVGAVDEDLDDSGFHNLAGPTEDFFLVAPGVNVVTTEMGGGITEPGVSGTSFATPHVSGALALLLDLFPSLPPEDAVQIILDTATDLGEPGADQIFGQGLVNLEAAVVPLGSLSIPLGATVAGPSADLLRTEMTLGAAFGDALSRTSFLGEAIILDAYTRPYKIDLGDNISRAGTDFGLDAFVDSTSYRQLRLPSFDGSSLVVGFAEPKSALASSGPLPDSLAGGREFTRLSLAGALGERTSLRLGFNESSETQLAFGPAEDRYRSLFWAADDLTGPQFGLLGEGGGAALSHRLDDATALSFGWFQGQAHAGLEGGIGRGSLAQLHLGHVFASGATLGLGVGFLDEHASFLNSQTGGAFGLTGGSESRFFTLSGTLPVGDWQWLELWGSFTAATTTVADEAGALLGDWGTVHSNAFVVGVVAEGLLSAHDRLGVLVGQPLRVFAAQATLTLPTSLDLEGNVAQESRRINVTPEGREIDLQLAYERPLSPAWTLSSWLMMRRQPGHHEGAGAAFGGGLKIRLGF